MTTATPAALEAPPRSGLPTGNERAADPNDPAAQPRDTPDRHEQAAQEAVAANSSHVRFHLGDTTVDLALPPLDKIAFYAGLGGVAAFGLIDWPIALLTAIGHLLSDDRRNRTLRALGEALDAL